MLNIIAINQITHEISVLICTSNLKILAIIHDNTTCIYHAILFEYSNFMKLSKKTGRGYDDMPRPVY